MWLWWSWWLSGCWKGWMYWLIKAGYFKKTAGATSSVLKSSQMKLPTSFFPLSLERIKQGRLWIQRTAFFSIGFHWHDATPSGYNTHNAPWPSAIILCAGLRESESCMEGRQLPQAVLFHPVKPAVYWIVCSLLRTAGVGVSGQRIHLEQREYWASGL